MCEGCRDEDVKRHEDSTGYDSQIAEKYLRSEKVLTSLSEKMRLVRSLSSNTNTPVKGGEHVSPGEDSRLRSVSTKIKSLLKLGSSPPPASPLAAKPSPSPSSPGVVNNPVRTSLDLDREEFDVAFCHAQFAKCNGTTVEYQKFLDEAVETIAFTKQSTEEKTTLIPNIDLSMGASSRINKWRAKQKQNNLYGRYDTITANVNTSDSILRFLTGKAMMNTGALIIQCKHLKPRLVACVKFNIKELEYQSPLVRDFNLVMDILKETEVSLQNMLVFFDEVGHLKVNEDRLRQHTMMAYVPWAQRNSMSIVMSSDTEGAASKEVIKRKSIEKRLTKTRKVDRTVDVNK